MFKRLLKSVRENKWPALLAILIIAGEALIETTIPTITADLVNSIKAGINLDELWRTGLKIVILALVSLCCGASAGFFSAKASAGFAKNLRKDMYAKIQTYSFANIDKFSVASLVTRQTTDVMYAQMSFMTVIRTAIRSPLMLIFSVIRAYRMGGVMAASFLVLIPVLIIGLIIIAKKAMPVFERVFTRYDKLNESIEENVRAMRVVKGFAREDYENEKFNKASSAIAKEFVKADRIVAWNSPLMQFCIYCNYLFVLTVGSMLVVKTHGTALNVGQISALLTYGVSILMSLMMLSSIYIIITISMESFRRINEVLVEESTIKSPEDAVMEVKDGSIEFRDVNFKYSEKAERYALSDIDLKIESGMTVGIMGVTGSGKSTLVQLIPRLYDVTNGSIMVGGEDVRNYDLTVLRDSVAMVLQKNELFAGTVRENLKWGNPNATDEELIEACGLAQTKDFLDALPAGFDKLIEQGGTNVSGGQKQRLCIARALLKKPKILILDDSTSAVDTKTDALIRKGLKTYLPETTKLIIAQRVSSVQDADMIIIMDGGSIAAAGTHEELLEKSAAYQEIFEQQTKGGEDNE